MQFSRIAAATMLFAIGGAASAQSMRWSHRIAGAVDPDSTSNRHYPYYPDTSLDQSRPQMAWTPAGTPGVVTFGSQSTGVTLAVKLAATDGAELWRAPLPGGAQKTTYSIAVDRSGDIVASGAVKDAEPFDVWSLRKISGATGQVIFDQAQVPPDSASGALVAVAADSTGDIVAIGTRDDVTSPQFYLLKFAGSNGNPLWLTSITNHLAGNEARIVVDAVDNVVAAPGDALLIKAAPDGAPSWIADLSQHPGSGVCAIRALAIDPATSDAIVAGRSYCATTPASSFVARVRASDGAVVWLTGALGAAPATDVTVLALDGAGRLVVAGGGASDASSPWFAARLSLADGSVDWSVPADAATRYAPTDLAFAANGDVLLTGICADNAYCAASLDVGTGTQRWIVRTGAAYVPDQQNYSNAIVAAGGGVFFGGKDTSGDETTWTVHRIDDDAIYRNGFE